MCGYLEFVGSPWFLLDVAGGRSLLIWFATRDITDVREVVWKESRAQLAGYSADAQLHGELQIMEGIPAT